MIHACACAMLLLGADSTAVSKSFNISHLTNGQRFEIQTEDCAYRAELLDRTTGECKVRLVSGERMTEPRTVFLIGATRGVQDRLTLIKMHEVCVGMKLEIGLDDRAEINRAHTTTVTGFTLDPQE